VQLSFADLVEDAGSSHPHLHAGYDSVAFTTAAPLAPRALTTFLRTRPAGLYRVKGAVAFGPGPDHRFTLHAVGRFLRFQPDPGGDGTTRLVLIGAGIDGEALRKELAACTAPTPATERDLWEVLRFVDAPGEAEDPA
jgi:G3E family GTPase